MSKTPDKKPENDELVSPSEISPDLKSFQKGKSAKPALDDDITLTSDNVVLKEHLTRPDGLIGTVIAEHFRIDARLAEGGMSAVYKAKDLLLGRDVAIKVLLPGRHFTEESLLRFQREAKAVGILNHPNIVKVYEMNTFAEGEPYIAMEFVEGDTLADQVKGTSGLPVGTAIDIMRQCAGALSYAHKQGIIHRDVKSGNIMLTRASQGGWQPKLVDFGIARALEEDAINLTRTGDIFGSPRYMSPEQCRGEKIDVRSDIYSFGCAFYECLTGDVPFKGVTALDTMRMHNDDEAIPPSEVRKGMHLGCELDRIVLKCLAKDRAHRYQTAEALEQDLSTISHQSKNSIGSIIAGSVRKLPFGKSQRNIYRKIFLVYFLVSAGILVWLGASQSHRLFDLIWSDMDYKGQKAFDQGDYKKAAEHFQTALKIAETMPVSARHMMLAINLTDLTELATATGDEEAHKSWLERKKREVARALGDISTHRGSQIKLCNDSLERFIVASKDAGSGNDAEELRLKAKQVLEQFNDLSMLFDTVESLESAYFRLDHALKVTEPYLKKTDRELVEALVGHAWLAFFANASNTRQLISDAESALRNSKEMTPSLKAHNLSYISQIYLSLGDRDAARKCSEEAIDILRANAEMQSDTAIHTLLVRAMLEDETRHHDTADFFFNQARFAMEAPEQHSPAVRERYSEVKLHLLSNRGATLHALEESKAILDEEEKHPTTRRLLVSALFSTGTLCGWLGAEAEGIHLLERAHAVAVNNHELSSAGAALDMIGEILGAHNKFNDAIPYFRRARDIYAEHPDVYSNSVVATSNNLALLLMKQGKYAEAIRVLQKAEPAANLPTFGAPKFKQVLYDRLAILSEKTGDKAAAERYRRKFAECIQAAAKSKP